MVKNMLSSVEFFFCNIYIYIYITDSFCWWVKNKSYLPKNILYERLSSEKNGDLICGNEHFVDNQGQWHESPTMKVTSLKTGFFGGENICFFSRADEGRSYFMFSLPFLLGPV